MQLISQTFEVSLDGLWDFYYIPGCFDCNLESLPLKEKFTGKMITPGYWDDHYELFSEEDFFGLTARFNPDYRPVYFPMARSLTPHAATSFLIGTGFYRKDIYVNDFRQVVLNVGPSMWGCSVFCNGKFVGVQTGYSTATEFDLSDYLVANQENELIIVVCNRHDDGGAYCRLDGTHAGMNFGTRPGQHRGLAAQGFQSERGGIGGSVKLKFTGKARIKDFFISFEDSIPHWHIELANSDNCIIKCKIEDFFTKEILCSSNQLDFFTPEIDLMLWSDHNPKLYEVTLELLDNNYLLDKITFNWGAVKMTAEGKELNVNGIPTFLRGVTEHCYFPETTNPHFDKEKYLHDLGVLKRAGFNFIRCHTWCPPEPFYDACDELGIFVQTELPSVYSFQEAEYVIKMIRRHPCAVLFCEGNEKMLDDLVISRLKKLGNLLNDLAPGILYMPQEALRGVDCHLTDPTRKLKESPYLHDPERLEQLDVFSDVYGPHLQGYCSYGHDLFLGPQKVNEFLSIYKKPVLLHEVGIMGGYLDFNLESRYENTYIGTDIFKAARANMIRKGVWQHHEKYYKLNTLFVSAMRKQLLENIRSCSSVAGFDYLGGIDTHWHLNGYPCGVFNEFYEEKYNESITDIARYNSESILIIKNGKYRNNLAGSSFEKDVMISHYGQDTLENGKLHCIVTKDDEIIYKEVKYLSPIKPGLVAEIAQVSFILPIADEAYRFKLHLKLEVGDKFIENAWDFFAYPKVNELSYNNVRQLKNLTAEDVKYLSKGGAVLLTSKFPGEIFTEAYRPHTSGRSIGHSGTVIHEHPIWNYFPHSGYAEWNFFPLMTDSTSLTTDEKMPSFTPILELIPSFKLIKRKSLLSEYQVGNGRLFICGLRLDVDDPAAPWMNKIILDYLENRHWANAPVWSEENLMKKILEPEKKGNTGMKIDCGGRPIEE